MGQRTVETLYSERRHVDIHGSDDNRTAVEHHVGAAFHHDCFQDRFQRDFDLPGGFVEARLNLLLPRLHASLERLLLVGEFLLHITI